MSETSSACSVVLTRPFEYSVRFAKLLPGCDVVIEPVLQIVKFYPDSISSPNIIVLTSANAVHCLHKISDLEAKRFFCVGRATADALIDQGVSQNQIKCIASTSSELCSMFKGGSGDRILYLRGKDVSFDLSGVLRKAGFVVTEEIVYEACMLEEFSSSFIAKLRSSDIDAVAFFSKRSAEAFVSLARQSNIFGELKTIRALCISASVLESVDMFFNEESAASETPDSLGMVNLIIPAS